MMPISQMNHMSGQTAVTTLIRDHSPIGEAVIDTRTAMEGVAVEPDLATTVEVTMGHETM